MNFTQQDIDRFWSKVLIRGPDECWLWTGGLDKDGYGELTVQRIRVSAHRMSWRIKNGAIPDDKMILHNCDNRSCVNNVKCLYVGTHQQNMNDMVKRNLNRGHGGGAPSGSRNRNSKLTEDQVLEIRRRHAEGETQASLAIEFNYSSPRISDIIRRMSWRHV